MTPIMLCLAFKITLLSLLCMLWLCRGAEAVYDTYYALPHCQDNTTVFKISMLWFWLRRRLRHRLYMLCHTRYTHHNSLHTANTLTMLSIYISSSRHYTYYALKTTPLSLTSLKGQKGQILPLFLKSPLTTLLLWTLSILVGNIWPLWPFSIFHSSFTPLLLYYTSIYSLSPHKKNNNNK